MQNATFDNSFAAAPKPRKNARGSGRNTGRGASRNKSLVAFLGAIKFLRDARSSAAQQLERGFARPQPQARQRKPLADERYCIRSAN